MAQKPKRAKIIRPDTEGELAKKRAAEERARRAATANRGTAANILAQSDTFGSGASAKSVLGGLSSLG